MTVFPNWHAFATHQRHSKTGCIPTGYEMLLRAAGAQGIQFDSFQEDFDLDLNRGTQKPRNNFESVATAVQKEYPHIRFEKEAFESGAEKIRFIDSQLAKQRPILVSLVLPKKLLGKELPVVAHIMPIVDAMDDRYLLLVGVLDDGTEETQWIEKDEVIRRHDKFPNGKDVAYLATCEHQESPEN